MALYCTEQDTLMIYRYSQEYGCGFLEFDPAQVTLTERGWRKTQESFAEICGCGDGILYCTSNDNASGNLLYYGSLDGQKAQILPEYVTMSTPAVYQKGFAFLINKRGKNCVEHVCVEQVVQKNKTLRLLKVKKNQENLFGCGFLMEDQTLDAEAFSLKVLARDRDFDLFLLSSRESVSYNIKENSVFYPLNEVDGVQEYLDACFPYVKELATDDEGNIWMLPVQTAVCGLLYNEEIREKNEVDYAIMNWTEFLDFTAKGKTEHEEMLDVSSHVLTEQFFAQYLSLYDTFDTEEFRSYARKMYEIRQKYGEWIFNFQVATQIQGGKIPKFYYSYMVYSRDIEEYKELLGNSETIGIAGIPKISEDIGNVGTMTFLAVNPESENLETALEYISAFAKYMVTKQDSYLLSDESMYTDTPFVKDAYELYANAEIYFQMDANVYWYDFTAYLNGEMELEEMITEIERKYQLYIGE